MDDAKRRANQLVSRISRRCVKLMGGGVRIAVIMCVSWCCCRCWLLADGSSLIRILGDAFLLLCSCEEFNGKGLRSGRRNFLTWTCCSSAAHPSYST